MRKSFWLAVLCLCMPFLAFGDEITSISPATWFVGSTEEFLTIRGVGLRGNVETSVIFNGPAGVFEVDVPPGFEPTLIETWIPIPVLLTTGQVAVTVKAVDDNGVRIIGPAIMNVIARPVEQPPLLSYPEAVGVEATSRSGAVATFTVTATSFTQSQATVQCNHQSGVLYPLGATLVTCTASDAFGNTSGSFFVTVVDTVAPTLTLPANITTGDRVVTFQATATDAIYGNITPTCSPASGSTFPVGTTTVVCTATDDDANLARGTFTVTVTSPDVPVLTLPANFTAEATGPNGANVSYVVSATLNATIVCSPISGTLFHFDVNTVNCVATTAQGGESSGSFQVNVVDTTAPALSLPGTINATASSGSGAIVTYSASATDLVDGAVAVNCNPPSGALFPVGSTTVQCSATDIRANASSGSFVVNVSQVTPPPVLNVPADITAEATSAAGRVVNYTVTSNAPFTCSPPSGSTFALGATTVNCSATNAGGTTNRSFTITIVDTTPPSLALPGNITVEATSANGAVVTFTASATDLVDGVVAVSCVPPSGSTFALGVAFVTCTATDSRGNSALGFFDVSVQDTTPPQVVTVTATDTYLWPPNHEMWQVGFTVNAIDLVDPNPLSHIVSITSNQPDNGTGDGDTAGDIEITGPMSAKLRAERSGNNERLYTVTFETTDASGNVATSSYVVHVAQAPKPRGRPVR